MSQENFTFKSPKEGIRVDHDQKLIFIPGKDEPLPLINPIVQKVDSDGTPYQHVVSATELIEAEEQHNRCMRFVRNAMAQNWKCSQCGKVRAGTQLRCSTQLLDLLREMMEPGGHRVDWNSIVDHLHEHLICPDVKCAAPCSPVKPEAV